MKFALHFGNNTFPDAAGAARLARLAEAAGFDSVFAVDHVVIPDDYASTYPYAATGRLPGDRASPFPDPLIWMAFAAAATTRLRLMTGVIILPQREPLVLAKQVATLDAMSGGRIELGIGVGWLREEFAALGVPFERRGRRADEYVAAMRALWREDGASFAGEFVRFERVSCNPKPVARGVPIIVGGHSEAAARRAGRLGDGFFPSIGAQVDTMPLLDLARRTAEAAGRDPAAVEMITGCPDALPQSGKDPLAAVEERRARGIGRVALPVGAFMPDLEDSLPRFGERVIRHFNKD
jgi:probable F420-dependent oxidoreductase